MKRSLPLIIIFLLIPAFVFSHTGGIEQFSCPIDGEKFSYRVSYSGSSFGQRLDMKRVGPIIDPWPTPQCPKCRFVLFKETFKPAEIPTIRDFVLSDIYKKIDKNEVPCYFIAVMAENGIIKDADSFSIAIYLLQASWQVENDNPREKS